MKTKMLARNLTMFYTGRLSKLKHSEFKPKLKKMCLKKLSFCIMMITLLAGCTKEDLGALIPYEIILEGQTSYAEQAIIPGQYLLIKNETDWDNFLPEIERVDPYLVEDLRNLNFDFIENYLIIIIGKYYNNCCSTINVNGVFKENENIVVKYSETGPAGFNAVSQAYTLLTI